MINKYLIPPTIFYSLVVVVFGGMLVFQANKRAKRNLFQNGSELSSHATVVTVPIGLEAQLRANRCLVVTREEAFAAVHGDDWLFTVHKSFDCRFDDRLYQIGHGETVDLAWKNYAEAVADFDAKLQAYRTRHPKAQ